MFRVSTVAAFVAGALFVVAPALLIAQNAAAPKKPATAMVGIFHVAPGKQLEFLKFQAAQDAAARDAGVAPAAWYAHLEGDSWDYVSVGPVLTEAENAKVDAAAKKRGLKVGPQGGLEFRKLINAHTDTLVAGPMTSAELLDRVK